MPSKEALDLVKRISPNSKSTKHVYDVLVSVRGPDEPHVGHDVVLVIDVSGSMGSLAKDSSAGEADGLTLLDLVVHASRTVVASLSKHDHVAVVAFDSSAHVAVPLTQATAKGKEEVVAALSSLAPGSTTNLWDGIMHALELLEKADTGRMGSVFVLTDGVPNVNPPRGIVPTMQRFLDQHSPRASVSTFGFGYSLDSALLDEIASLGGGSYAFIPDAGLVGTIFVNALATLQATASARVTMSVEALDGAKVIEAQTSPLVTRTKWGAQVAFGSVQAGQTRDVVVQMSVPPAGARKLVPPFVSASTDSFTAECASLAQSEAASRHALRQLTVGVIRFCVGPAQLEEKRAVVAHLLRVLRESNAPNELVLDVSGQVCEAVSRPDWYDKWGRHYLRSLANAHERQCCNNFKDPGVQLYGGTVFSHLRDVADDLFVKLPPPKPSRKNVARAPVRMSNYYCSGAPCFDGSCLARMADGSERPVRSLRAGDRVTVPGGRAARIRCVVRTAITDGETLLVRLGSRGLLVTPYHPVRISGTWRFPADLATPELRACAAVYSFLLDSGHVMLIDGIECVSYAHGFSEDVVAHPFFGTSSIINSLSKLPGWNDGLVHLSSGCTIRDSSGLVIDLCSSSEISV